MRMGISAVPQHNVESRKDRGVDVAFLYKDVQQTTDAEGNAVVTADVQIINFPAGANQAEIEENFNFYFGRAEAQEVKNAVEAKVGIVERLLSGTDYKALKLADGALSAVEYEPWKKLRQHWRDTVNAMQACKTVEELDAIKYAQTPEELAEMFPEA